MSRRQLYLLELRSNPVRYQSFADVAVYRIGVLSNRELERLFIQNVKCRELLDKNVGF